MSRKSQTAKAVVLAGAVAASAMLTGSASAATPTVTKAGPAKAATNVAQTIAITGKDFDATIKAVVFDGTADCTASSIVLVSATLLYATTPTSGCANGVQKIELHNDATPAATTQIGTDFAPSNNANTVTFVAPVKATGVKNGTGAASATNKGDGLAAGGTVVNVLHEAVSPVTTPIKATIGGKTVPVKRVDDTHFTTTVPAGTPGDADVVLTANGVSGAAYAGFTYKQGLKVTPNFGLASGTTEVKVTGVGFKPTPAAATFKVEVCGDDRTSAVLTSPAAKVRTDKQFFVLLPSDTAGACDVVVTTDLDGSGSDHAEVASVVTKDSTFTYTAY